MPVHVFQGFPYARTIIQVTFSLKVLPEDVLLIATCQKLTDTECNLISSIGRQENFQMATWRSMAPRFHSPAVFDPIDQVVP